MRSRLTAIIAATLLLGFVAPPAQAAAPDGPVLVSPASGSTATGTSIPLSVTASDPDGGSLTVRFEGRKIGATSAPAPFTLVAVPDIQNYTYSDRTAILNQHLQWIADSRSALNTAMVTQLGDLVSTYTSSSQWQIASNAFKILDDAGVPNTVVGGNHDFDNTTGAFPLYDTYFGPSRYVNANWTPSSASYAGYLGENLFGPDPVDQKNMDNFALFSAGGVDFLMLNLEWEAPKYALDWAAKVVDAYPDRLVIISTHAFLAENANRSTITERAGGSPTPPDTIWNNFVKTHCSIRLVLNGHYHNSTGEARRSDVNTCGNTVQQVLSNYQDRPNGGDGWLRYYTFDPVADTMTAKTYSTRLNQFEIDDSSQFTLPFVLPDAPLAFTPIGTATITSGGTATTTWTGLDPAATYEWRAVADDSTNTGTSPTWTVSTPGATPTELARDGFNRIGSRWGTAEIGGAWTDSGASYFATDGSYGQVAVSRASSGPSASLAGVSARDVSLTTDFTLAAKPVGGTFYHQTTVRARGTSFYQLAIRIAPTGVLTLELSRSMNGVSTTLQSLVLSAFGYTAGERLKVRFDATGDSSTTLKAKVWRATGTEPAQPQVVAIDGTSALQVAGSVGLKFYTGSGTTSLPTKISVDGFQVLASGVAAPVNQPPIAAFSATMKSWRVSVDASASTDDRSISGYAWDYGDTATGTGKTDSHTYAADGTYTVKLTVTDDQGLSTSLSKQVSATNSAPTASFTATTSALAVSVDASASADDGSISGYAWDYGDVATGTGKTDSHTYAADGTYIVTLTVTDDTGKTGVATRQVSVAKPVQSVIASDAFARTLPSSWGTADTGGNWTINTTTMFSVDGSKGRITIPNGGRGPMAYLGSASVRDLSLVTDFALDKTPAGGPYTHQLMARMNGTSSWCHLVARLETSGALVLELGRMVSGTTTTIKSIRLTGFSYTAGERLQLRLDVVGTGTTTLSGKVWRSTDTEPATAQLTATDSTSSLQNVGAVGVKGYTSSAATSVPLVVSVDSFKATATGT